MRTLPLSRLCQQIKDPWCKTCWNALWSSEDLSIILLITSSDTKSVLWGLHFVFKCSFSFIFLSIGALCSRAAFEVGFDVSFIYYGSGDISWWQSQIHFLRDEHGNGHMEREAIMIFPVMISALLLSTFCPGEGARVGGWGWGGWVHRTHGIRQQVKIVYYRTGFIVEALPHI